MRNGFTYNNRHTSEFGVTVKTKSRPIRPSVKSVIQDLPYRDGYYDFTEANPDNREHYFARVFTVALTVTADNLTELQKKISALSLWLDGGKGELVFDDIPFIIWRGRIMDEVIYMPEHSGRSAVMEISFNAYPFGYGMFSSLDGPRLDTAIVLDDALPIGLDELYTYTVKRSADLTVINFGDRPVKPVIEITGSAANVTLSMKEKTLSFKAGGSVTVDFEKQTVTGASGSIAVSGEFFELGEGASVIRVTNSNSYSLTVTVGFTPEYMYSVDYKESKWG